MAATATVVPASPASMRRFEEGENLFVFLCGQVGADSHVQHGHVPLRVAIGIWGADVVAMPAVLRPEGGSALARGRGFRRGGSGWAGRVAGSGSGAAGQKEAEAGQNQRGGGCG